MRLGSGCAEWCTPPAGLEWVGGGRGLAGRSDGASQGSQTGATACGAMWHELRRQQQQRTRWTKQAARQTWGLDYRRLVRYGNAHPFPEPGSTDMSASKTPAPTCLAEEGAASTPSMQGSRGSGIHITYLINPPAWRRRVPHQTASSRGCAHSPPAWHRWPAPPAEGPPARRGQSRRSAPVNGRSRSGGQQCSTAGGRSTSASGPISPLSTCTAHAQVEE